MRAYSPTVGATDGSIIAAIITAHTPRNQPSVPRPVHGPSSMSLMRCPLDHHPTAAAPHRSAMSVGCDRAAAMARAGAAMLIRSGGPGELGLREAGLALVLDAEGADARALRLRHREIRPDWVEHAGESHRLAGLHSERNDVLDLEVDPVADANAVPHAVVLDRDG